MISLPGLSMRTEIERGEIERTEIERTGIERTGIVCRVKVPAPI
jgi:hypothetical protein